MNEPKKNTQHQRRIRVWAPFLSLIFTFRCVFLFSRWFLCSIPRLQFRSCVLFSSLLFLVFGHTIAMKCNISINTILLSEQLSHQIITMIISNTHSHTHTNTQMICWQFLWHSQFEFRCYLLVSFVPTSIVVRFADTQLFAHFIYFIHRTNQLTSPLCKSNAFQQPNKTKIIMIILLYINAFLIETSPLILQCPNHLKQTNSCTHISHKWICS